MSTAQMIVDLVAVLAGFMVLWVLILRPLWHRFTKDKSAEPEEGKKGKSLFGGLFGGKGAGTPEVQAGAAEAKAKKKEVGRTARSDVRTARRSDIRVASEVGEIVKGLHELEKELLPKNPNKVNWKKSENKLEDLAKLIKNKLGGYVGVISKTADEVGTFTSDSGLKRKLEVNKNEMLIKWEDLKKRMKYILKEYESLKSNMTFWDEVVNQLGYSAEDAKAIGNHTDAVLVVIKEIEQRIEK